jgi:uncharacterized protein YdaU (DUF1376 family)
MNYYKKHLGDYAKKTGHLSPLEHGVYSLIMDAYYDREQGPTLIEATRWARAKTEEEKSAVLAVLDEFFTLEGERYKQNRIEEELAAYRAQAEVNRGIAVERERRKRERREHGASTNRAPVVHDTDQNREPSHKPLANSHKPVEEDIGAGAPDGGEDRRQGSADIIEEVLAAESAKRVPSLEHQVGVVFEHWKLVMDSPRSAFDDKRKALIKKSLKLGYAVEDLCAAIDGCKKSDFHMARGEYAGRNKHNGLDLILRDANKIDQFITIGRSPRVPMPAGPSRPGAAPMTMMHPNGSDYSSNAAAAARTQAQFGVSADGDLDFN